MRASDLDRPLSLRCVVAALLGVLLAAVTAPGSGPAAAPGEAPGEAARRAAASTEVAPGLPSYPDRVRLLVVIGAEGKERPVTSTKDWAIRRDHIIRSMEEVMGPLPRAWGDLPLDPRVDEVTELPSCVRKKVSYRVEPDDRVPAYLLVPRERNGKAPAVLCLHPTTDIGKDEPAGLGGKPDLRYAAELAERGYVTLAPDFWTFGDYRGKEYDPYEHGYSSGTMKGIWSHVRSVSYLASLDEVDPDRIGCIGHSLGGHNALWLGAFDARVKAIVTSCGFNTFASYAASPYGGGSLANYAQRRYMPRIASAYGNDPAKVPFDFPEVLGAIAPRPVFINAPLGDENFVVSGVRDSVRAARPVYELHGAADQLVAVHPDAGHAFPADVRRQAYEFLDAALRGGSRAPVPPR